MYSGHVLRNTTVTFFLRMGRLGFAALHCMFFLWNFTCTWRFRFQYCTACFSKQTAWAWQCRFRFAVLHSLLLISEGYSTFTAQLAAKATFGRNIVHPTTIKAWFADMVSHATLYLKKRKIWNRGDCQRCGKKKSNIRKRVKKRKKEHFVLKQYKIQIFKVVLFVKLRTL